MLVLAAKVLADLKLDAGRFLGSPGWDWLDSGSVHA